MNKIFLYLYPIKEFNRPFLFSDDFYIEEKREKPFDVLNECIQKRYRDQGYQVIYVLYPDKKIFGIKPGPQDQIIYTDISFQEAMGFNKDGSRKNDDEIRYPNEQFLIDQLGAVDKLVIGGFHFGDCVKRVAECCLQNGIDTLVDLDLTDLFFSLYYQEDYFKKDSYSPERYRDYWFHKASRYDSIAEKIFQRKYASPVYQFYQTEKQKSRK